jgi:hypothetical protein
VRQQGFDFRAEHQPIALLGDVQRLDADAIARQQQPPADAVPQRKREHAAQVVDAVRPVLLIQVQDGLAVGARAVGVAARFQARPVLGMVIDLSVEDEPQAAILVAHRLIARDEVDDAQPSEPEAQPSVWRDGVTVGIGPAVRDGLGHIAQHACLDRLRLGPEAQDTGNAAHTRNQHSAVSSQTAEPETSSDG